MTPVHDVPSTINDIFNEVQSNLYDLKLRWFTTLDINNSIQDQYNKLVALLAPIEKSVLINQLSEPYYNLSTTLSDYMYVVGIYNPVTNLWLSGGSYRDMKATFQTYLAIGQPRFFNIVDFKRVLVWPYLPSATGVLYIIYKAVAPTISANHTPILPYGVGSRILEYMTTADLLEQSREFKKAQTWWNRIFDPGPSGRSIYQQCKSEIESLARMDRELVLEPYRWLFHGGTYTGSNQISGETPMGTADGVNTIFTLNRVPNPSNSLVLTKNAVLMILGTDYNINGQTINFNVAPAIASVLVAGYLI